MVGGIDGRASQGDPKDASNALEQHEGLPPSRGETLKALQDAFEAAGVEFIGTPEQGPGVRLWTDRNRKGQV